MKAITASLCASLLGATAHAESGGPAVSTCHPGAGDDILLIYDGLYGNGALLSPWSPAQASSVGRGPTAVALCSAGARLTSASARLLYLDYRDASATAQVACTAYMLAWDGATVWWAGATRRSSAAGVAASTFSWTIPAEQLGYVDIECSVPADDDGAAGQVGSAILGVTLQ